MIRAHANLHRFSWPWTAGIRQEGL